MHVRPKKRFGQHFLVNEGAARKIVAAAQLSGSDLVVEIGAGQGALTSLLAGQLDTGMGKVVAVEIDAALCALLRENFASEGRVEIVERDALDLDLEDITQAHGGEKVIVVGNLPYNVAAAIIESLLGQWRFVRRLVLTLQEEVADRLVARPGTADYGIPSVAVQYRAEVEKLFTLRQGSFRPPPKVRSAVVRLNVRSKPAVELDDVENLFFSIVRAGFGQRRKKLRNALQGILGTADRSTEDLPEDLQELLGRRAQEMSLEGFARLTNGLAYLGCH